MSDEPKKRRSWAWTTLALLLLLMAYPLSMGPALRYSSDFRSVFWGGFYEPVAQLSETWRPLENLKDWYMGLWGVGYDRNPATGVRRLTMPVGRAR
jgi:hypothetical protein